MSEDKSMLGFIALVSVAWIGILVWDVTTSNKDRQEVKAKCWEKAAELCQDRPDQIGCVKALVELCDERR